MRTIALVSAAGLAMSANAQDFVVLLHNSFETTIRADENEFATASVGSTTSQSLYPLNTMPLSPDPVTETDPNDPSQTVFVFNNGVLFQPAGEFDGGGVDLRFDSPQTGNGLNGGNFGFIRVEDPLTFELLTSSSPISQTGLPTTGDDRNSILTQDSLLAVPSQWATSNGFGSGAALSGLNFVGGDDTVETPFELFFQDVQNNGIFGPVDFSGGPGGSGAAFFTGESTGDFVGTYPAFTFASFLRDLELVNTETVMVEEVEEEFEPDIVPGTEDLDEFGDPIPGTGEIETVTVSIDDEDVDFPVGNKVTTTEMVELTVGDIRGDANFDGVIETFEDGTVENLGSQAYEFNDIDGAIILQFETIPAAESQTLSTLQLGFHWARNATGYEDENLNFFSTDITGDGEPDLLIDTNGDGVPDGTGNQQPDLLQVYINDVLIFEAGAEARVQSILDGATVRQLALEFGLFDPLSANFGGVAIPETEFTGFGVPGAPGASIFNISYTPRLQEDPFGAAGTGDVGSFLPDGSPLPFVPGPTDLDLDGSIGGVDINGDGIVGTFVNEGPDPVQPGPGNDDDSENPLDDNGLVPVGGKVVEQDPDEIFSDQNSSTWPQAFFDFVDASDGTMDGVLGISTGPLSTASVIRNIDSNTAGGSLPVLAVEDFLPELIDVSEFIGQDITLTVVAQTTAGSETLAIDNLTIRGTETVTVAGDADGDGDIDIIDIVAGAGTGAFFADVTGEGVVNFFDILARLAADDAAMGG